MRTVNEFRAKVKYAAEKITSQKSGQKRTKYKLRERAPKDRLST